MGILYQQLTMIHSRDLQECTKYAIILYGQTVDESYSIASTVYGPFLILGSDNTAITIEPVP
jgi:hypothetical protein